ncbi:MAG: HDOD domain-containing protein [Variovorax sp.]
MRFDFFKRQGTDAVAIDRIEAAPTAIELNPDGYLTYALLLDPQKRVVGLRPAWHLAAPQAAASVQAQFKAMVACMAKHLNAPKTGWRLGGTVLYLDLSAELLAASELQSLPPEKVVLCLGPADLADAGARPLLLFLREQGYGVLLKDAEALPEEEEARGIVTHFGIDAVQSHRAAALLRQEQPGEPPLRVVSTGLAAWKDFDACAAQHLDVFVEGAFAVPPMKPEPGRTLQPESMLIVKVMQMIQRNEDLREIETALKHDAALTYRLLRHINSPAIGVGVEIHSLRHAMTMLGYAPLFRWLSLLLATSNSQASPPYLMKKAIMRGRFVELMGKGLLPASESDNLFVVGMFSLIDQLLGVSMAEVLDKVQLSESVQQAILSREGTYGPFLALAEMCEQDGAEAARLAEELFMSAEQVNAAHLSALAWAQDVSPAAETK